MNNNQINCDIHDNIEVCCLYKYKVKIITKKNNIIETIANDIKHIKDIGESLELINNCNESLYIALNKIENIYVLTKNSKLKDFKVLTIKY